MKGKCYVFHNEKPSCSGCGACAQICKQKAIAMETDEEGFLYPILNKDKCVGCGMCEKVCPYSIETANQRQGQKQYVATTDSKSYYKESATIGICTMLADYIISINGVVFGAYLDETDYVAYHVLVRDRYGVRDIRNSKYLQSDTRNTFPEARCCLENGVPVLYIGTPCEFAGLKSFLRKKYTNLYTLDLMCHGTFSPKLMRFEVEYWQSLFNGKIKNFRFRSKRKYKLSNGGMVNFDVVTANGKKKHIERFAGSSPTYKCYTYSGDGHSYNLRPSCYSCVFKDKNRYGDITIGDPWGVRMDIITEPSIKKTPAIRSLYMVNTVQGNNLLKEITHLLSSQEIPKEEAFKQGALLPISLDVPPLRQRILKCATMKEYVSLIEQHFGCNLEKEHVAFDKRYKRQYIKHLVKKYLHLNKR